MVTEQLPLIDDGTSIDQPPRASTDQAVGIADTAVRLAALELQRPDVMTLQYLIDSIDGLQELLVAREAAYESRRRRDVPYLNRKIITTVTKGLLSKYQGVHIGAALDLLGFAPQNDLDRQQPGRSEVSPDTEAHAGDWRASQMKDA